MTEAQTTETSKAADEAAKNKVKMDHGEEIEFGKRTMTKDDWVGEDGSLNVRINFSNGKSLTWTIPARYTAKCALHGAKQKLGDEVAGLKAEGGVKADVDDQFLAVEELIERLNGTEDDSGWSMQREGGGLAGASILAKALAELKSLPMEKVKAFLKTKTQAERMAMRANAQLKPIIERLEAEKVSKGPKVDSNAIIGELDQLAA
jgi:hypothetical protein